MVDAKAAAIKAVTGLANALLLAKNADNKVVAGLADAKAAKRRSCKRATPSLQTWKRAVSNFVAQRSYPLSQHLCIASHQVARCGSGWVRRSRWVLVYTLSMGDRRATVDSTCRAPRDVFAIVVTGSVCEVVAGLKTP